MHRFLVATAIVVLAAVAGVATFAGEMGAIKQFKHFPVATYDEDSELFSDTQLLKATTPSPDAISVDGWWPDKKMLLITIAGESYFVLFSDVEMNNQAYWNGKMAATGGVQCNYAKTTGVSPQTKTAATKRFASPC